MDGISWPDPFKDIEEWIGLFARHHPPAPDEKAVLYLHPHWQSRFEDLCRVRGTTLQDVMDKAAQQHGYAAGCEIRNQLDRYVEIDDA